MKFGKKTDQRKPDSKILLSGGKTGPRFTEAYRTLRTNIHFSNLDKPTQSLMITSTAQAEGKTITAANLGHIMSQTGNSVLMIDTDLRKPSLSKIVSDAESPGITGIVFDLFNTDIRKGSLTDMGIGDVLTLLSIQKKTGSLRIDSKNEKIEICFSGGKPVHVCFSNAAEKKLKKTLTEAGAQSNETLRAKSSDKLWFNDIYRRLDNTHGLKPILNEYVTEGFETLTQMGNGGYDFKENLSSSDLEKLSSIPADLKRLYEQGIRTQKTPFIFKEIDSAILRTDIPELCLLPAGVLPSDPSELLGSERMAFLISILKKKYGFLIFDTPPLQPASDALLLAPQTDGVVLVVRSGVMNRELIKKAVKQLRMVRANILGVVLNRTDPRKETYYRYYQKHYSYYYGEKE